MKLNTIKNLLFYSYYWIQGWFKEKDTNIWVFGAMRGEKYMDNAKYLFEYLHNETKINAVWISKNEVVVAELRLKGFNAYHERSSKAKYFSTIAKVAVITHRGNGDNGDLPFYFFSKQTKIIQLWHGIPLKKIAYDDRIFRSIDNKNTINYKIKSLIKNIFFPFLNYVHQPSMIIALGEETQDIFSRAFRVSKDKVKITGYPRYDILIKNRTIEVKEKKIIYMPTFRGAVGSNFTLYGFDFTNIDTFLKDLGLKLDIKLHTFNRPSEELLNKINKSNNISILDDVEIYETIHEYSILITDYSSIFFDFLLLDRPIIFAPFDKDIYLKKDREFYFNYEDITPGPKAKNWNDILKYIKLFNDSKDIYRQDRDKIKNRFHKYIDTKNCERTYKEILRIGNKCD